MDNLKTLTLAMRQFGEERDWLQFQSPKNLSMALAAESGELLECFQWLTTEQSQNLDEAQRRAVADEIADVQLYLVRLADSVNMDIFTECERKMRANADKYPIEKVRGSAKKYNQY